MKIKTTCPTCDGDREVPALYGSAFTAPMVECFTCAGTGEVERPLEDVMREACELDDEIKALTAEHITPLQDRLDDIKRVLNAAVVESGATVKTQYGRIEYVKAGERVTWNDVALLGFAVAHPEILSMRSTKETAPTTRIKFEVKP